MGLSWRRSLALVGFGSALFLALVGAATGILDALEHRSIDWRFVLQPSPQKDSNISVVALQHGAVKDPTILSRNELAAFLHAVADCSPEERPRAILVDILLSFPPTLARDGATDPIDSIIADSRKLGNVVHPLAVAYSHDVLHEAARDLSSASDLLLPTDAKIGFHFSYGVLGAHPEFADALYRSAAGLGTVSTIDGGQNNQSIHAFPLFSLVPSFPTSRTQDAASLDAPPESYLVPDLALAGISAATCEKRPVNQCFKVNESRLTIDGIPPISIPIPEDNLLPINYRRRFLNRASAFSLEMLSYDSATGLTAAPDVYSSQAFPLRELKNRIVLVIDWLERDQVSTPFGNDQRPATIHAQLMANMLEQDFIRRLPAYSDLLIAALFTCLVAAYRLLRVSPVSDGDGLDRYLPQVFRGDAGALFSITLWVGTCFFAYRIANYQLPMMLPIFSVTGFSIGWHLYLPVWTRRQLDLALGLKQSQEKEIIEAGVARQKLQDELDKVAEKLENYEDQARSQDESAQQLEGSLNEALSRYQELSQKLDAEKQQSAAERQDLEFQQSSLKREIEELESSRRAIEASRLYGESERAKYDALSLEFHRCQELLSGEFQRIHPRATSEDPDVRTTPISPELQTLSRNYEHHKQLLDALGIRLKALEPIVPDLEALLKQQLTRWESDFVNFQEQWHEQHALLSAIETKAPIVEHSVLLDSPDATLAETGMMVWDARLAQTILDFVNKFAATDDTILIRGETGSGKEKMAELIHRHSHRARLVTVNCSAIPRDMAESEFFGHAKGAFTGAMHKREGYFAEADNGTLFLDEVGELPLEMQSKLLRALREKRIQPIGSPERAVNIRILAATNRSLETMQQEGAFRNDLFSRLSVHEFTMPSLRDRRAEIPCFANYFLLRRNDEVTARRTFSSEALAVFQNGHHWPGNLAELDNVIKRLVGLDAQGEITAVEVLVALNKRTEDARDFSLFGDLTQRINLMRQHCFSIPDCVADPAYGVKSRGTVDLHIRCAMARALTLASMDKAQAANLLIGQSEPSRRLIEERMSGWLKGLTAKDDAAWESAFAEFRHFKNDLKKVRGALNDGRLRP